MGRDNVKGRTHVVNLRASENLIGRCDGRMGLLRGRHPLRLESASGLRDHRGASLL